MRSSDSRLPRRTALALGLVPALVFVGLAPVRAQTSGNEARKTPASGGAKAPTIKEPVAWRVYQRNDRNRADIPIVLDGENSGERIAAVSIEGANVPAGTVSFRDGKLINVPVGGAYRISVRLKPGETPESTGPLVLTVGPVFVGDVWVLAGQSNMEGVGNLADVTPPSDRVTLLGMDGEWRQAEEPLHWLVDSPDPVHHGNPSDRAARSEAQHKSRVKGAGLGLPFAVVLSSALNVPIGLVACAHGGTSMQQWDPAKKDEGGRSLYGSMLRQINLAGGKVRGVLWYQGESDASGPAADVFAEKFANFITSVRSDLGQPELPFYYVQIGRFVFARDPKGWNTVQDAQRQVADRVPNTAVVAAVDLELDDLIHVGTQGLKRLGTRLARIALSELFSQPGGGTTPTFDRVSKRADNALVVKFKGVNRPPGDPSSASSSTAGPTGLPADIRLSEPAAVAASAMPLRGLRPSRHIAGFSIRKDDGSEIPLIYDAAVGASKDTVILKLVGAVPAGASLWYGYGMDPYCNLTDALDMAVPVFGPISLESLK